VKRGSLLVRPAIAAAAGPSPTTTAVPPTRRIAARPRSGSAPEWCPMAPRPGRACHPRGSATPVAPHLTGRDGVERQARSCREVHSAHPVLMPLHGMHGRSDLARSFGAVAEEYDRYRPTYPEALIDDLVAAHPRRALDVGCGTGRAGLLLATRGVDVLGLEPDAAMAAVARRHGLTVQESTFESWTAPAGGFDLITFAQSWQYIDPAQAAPRLVAHLNPGGVVARIWNYHVFEPAVTRSLDAVYAELAPDAGRFGHDLSELDEPPDPLRGVTGLKLLPSRTYRWQGRQTTEEWVARIGTYADHRRLGPERLHTLQRRVAETIDDAGGVIDVRYATLCLLARRIGPGSPSDSPRQT
jgi:SAM-dependent methyltransferase